MNQAFCVDLWFAWTLAMFLIIFCCINSDSCVLVILCFILKKLIECWVSRWNMIKYFVHF